MYYFIIVKEKA